MSKELPLVGFHFLVRFGDGTIFDDVSFAKVEGIELKYKVESLSEGYGAHFKPSYSYDFTDLVLERGKTSKKSLLFRWLEIQVREQKILTIPIFVHVLNQKAEPILKWSFFGAFPFSFTTSGIDANSKDVMLEKITFKYSDFKFEQGEYIGPIQLKADKYAIAKNTLREARMMDGYLQKKPLKITPAGEKSSRLNRRTSRKKP